MIYFMQPRKGGPIKIGCSCDVAQRHKSLESHYNCELVVLKIIPGDFEDEKRIHAKFKHLRLDRSEQFQPASDLLEFIDSPLFAKGSSEAVSAMPARIPGPGSRKHAFGVRGREEWKDWLVEFANLRRMDLADLIDESLVANAQLKGFAKEPPKR